MTADDVRERGYNLDIKNPHVVAYEHQDPEELLRRLDEVEDTTRRLNRQLRAILEEALLR